MPAETTTNEEPKKPAKKESKLTLKGGGAKPRDEIKGLYVAVQGGASLDQDASGNLDLQGSGIVGTGVNSISPNSDIAGAFGFKLGYVPYRDLEEKPLTATFGAEIEFNYIGHEVDGTDASGVSYKSSLDTYQVMANLFLRAENKYVVPYVGAGFGLALFAPENTSIIRTGTELAQESDMEGAFAYQFMGGLEYQMFKQWSVFMEYRYLIYDSFTVSTGAVGTTNGKLKLAVDDFTQQVIQTGIKYRF
ncbi:MAG: outer membrane beta-barrel protein [Candidatus Methylacidiphilales bacterium]|nr:outer membrane beta-barrel protein [Candidatus Methylacidiphilales bacterium]